MRRPIPASTSTSRRLLLAVGAAALAAASPYPRDALHDVSYSYLMRRACPAPCGSDKQFCCESNEYCTTLSNNVATCAPAAGGAYGAYTTTWTETYTSTIMTHWVPAPAPTPGVDCKPQSPEQEPCGRICCAGWQTCAYKGQCSPRPGYAEPSTVVVTDNGVVTTRYSAPYRVTGTMTVVTSVARSDQPTETGTATTSSATSTNTSESDAAGGGGTTTGTGGGLSGGAIAGIVIGTLVGVALLILLCFCCIVRGLWGLIFGRKKDKEKDRVDIYEEHYSRHGSRVPSAHSRRDRHTGWFGGKPSSVGSRREKKKSDGKWWLGLAGGAATLAALLNLKKDKKPARKHGSSRYSDSYYTYSDATASYTSPSSSSSGGRTHRTHRTDRSRGSRGATSYYSRAPSRRP